MISETYLKLLKSEVKKIDDLTNSTYELEVILQDIVDNVKNADLEFIKRLGNLTSKETFSKIKDKQTGILELLYKYLGSRVIDINYLRALSRECELSAVDAFYKEGKVERLDMLKALNRLSSILYLMMLKANNGDYKS